MLAWERPSSPNAKRMTGSAKFPLLENMTVRRKLVLVFPPRCRGLATSHAMKPMVAVNNRPNAAMRPASPALIEEPTSWVNTRQGESAWKEIEERNLTLPPSRRSKRNPTPAMAKIGTTSEIRIDSRLVTDYRVNRSEPDTRDFFGGIVGAVCDHCCPKWKAFSDEYLS